MESDLITIKEAATRLGVTIGTLSWYIRDKSLVSVDKKKTALGYPQKLYRITDVDALTQLPKWRGPLQSPTEGRKLYLNHSYNAADEVHETGCIIHWTERFRAKSHTYVPMTCATCHTKFTKDEGGLKTSMKLGTFTGCCTKCYRKFRGKWAHLPSNGRFLCADGYVTRHIKTFTKEEQAIISQMPLSSNIYITEHRAVMALHLGRPLDISESVHHIDGNKSNNDIANLQLYGQNEHSQLHADLFNDMLDLKRRNEYLEQENIQLRQLLSDYNTT